MFRILIVYFIFLVSTQNTFSKEIECSIDKVAVIDADTISACDLKIRLNGICLLYTSPSPRDATLSRMPSSA